MNVDRIRQLLLERAIEGKLVPQLDSEPVVEQIGKAPEEVPFVIPRKWKWVRFSSVASLTNGRAYAKEELLPYATNRTPVLRVGNFFTNGKMFYSDLDLPEEKYCHSGDLLYAWSASFGPRIWEGERSIFHYHIWKVGLSDFVDKEWLYFWLLGKTTELRASGHGMVMVHITKKGMEQEIVALPPIEEQRRIVARLKELLSFVDSYEKNEADLERLSQLLKSAVLQKAIEGKLVPQLDSEPAVEQIGKAPEEVPFEIPNKWKWETLGTVIDYGKAKQIAGVEIEPDDWVLDLEDIEKETGVLLRKKRNVKTTSNKTIFKAGNVLYGKLRPYLNKVIIADEDGYCTTEIVVLDVLTARAPIDAGFLQIYLMSPLFVQYANDKSYGVKMPRLGTKDANAAVLPLPPLPEQRRIVARIKELFEQIDNYTKSREVR